MATINNRIRKYFFWILDFLKGSPIRRDFEDIKEKLERGLSPKDSLIALLRHATKAVPFYKNVQHERIESFPVVNKNLIRERSIEFVSSSYSAKQLIPVVTSGSTGTPFKIFHNKRKKIRNNADTLYFAGLSGFQPGHRLIYLKIWAKEKLASPFHYWKQNMIPVDVIRLNDKQIEEVIRSIEAKKCEYGILGYVSALELVCRYLEKSGKTSVAAKVNSILTMSESLSEYVRLTMEKYFGCKVYSRYSNLENGILAQQVPGSGLRFLVNTASYFVETLKMNEDVPADPDEAGRIVVTDLFNFAFTMIRYDTGDIGVLSKPDEKGRIYFESIEGRKLDVLYDTQGNVVSSYIMYKNMWKYTEIKQYQLVQEDHKKYVLKINCDSPLTKEKEIIDEFCKYLGKDADFAITYVNEIPLLDSGKRRKLVNEMINRI